MAAAEDPWPASAEQLRQLYSGALCAYEGAFDAATLMGEAESVSGLSDWGGARGDEAGFRVRLGALCGDLSREVRWNAQGRSRAHSRLYTMLLSRLYFVSWRKAHPVEAPVLPSLIGTGLPRTGTTFLFNLLAQDPDHLCPTAAQAAIPVPPPGEAVVAEQERNALYQAVLDFQGFSAPDVLVIHPYAADMPEECIFLQETACGSVFRTFFDSPSFLTAAAASAPASYHWQIALMQALQSGRGEGRWLLKSPLHLIQWDTMMATFRSEGVFINHRDPARVIPSIASLSAKIRSRFYREPTDPAQLGRQMVAVWSAAMTRTMEWRDANPDARVVDVHYAGLIADPINEAERLYRSFGLELSGTTRDRMHAFVQTDHHGRGPQHSYSLAEYGLTEDDIEAAFGNYIDRYGIVRERNP